MLLLTAIEEHMPHYLLDNEFRNALPPELTGHFDSWRQKL